MQWNNSRHTADFYIMRNFLSAFAFITAIFVVLAFILILFEELDALREHEVPFGLGLTYVFLRVPHEMIKAAPMVVVLSVVVCIGNLVRTNEMLMLYIAGYTPIRIAIPLGTLLAFIILGMIWMNEEIGGPFAARAGNLMETRIKHNQRGITGENGIWMYGEENRLFRAESYYPYANQLEGLNIFIFQGTGRTLSERIDAETAIWNVKVQQWILKNAVIYSIPEGAPISTDKKDTLEYSLGLTPDDLETVTQNVEEMSHGDLKRLVDTIRQAGENPWMYLPDLRLKEAFPFAVLFLGLLAFTVTLEIGKAGKTSGVGLGLIVVILYFMILSLGKSFAQAGAIPPWFGAWSPNLVCFVVTAISFNRLRKTV